MNQKEEFSYKLSSRSRVHVKFTRDGSRIIRFSVNLEIKFNDSWRPIIRFDNAHEESKKQRWKYPHKHIYHIKKRQIIVSLRHLNPKSALTLSIRDINENFKSIKYRYFI